jgi:hypothetical protein
MARSRSGSNGFCIAIGQSAIDRADRMQIAAGVHKHWTEWRDRHAIDGPPLRDAAKVECQIRGQRDRSRCAVGPHASPGAERPYVGRWPPQWCARKLLRSSGRTQLRWRLRSSVGSAMLPLSSAASRQTSKPSRAQATPAVAHAPRLVHPADTRCSAEAAQFAFHATEEGLVPSTC